MWNPFKKTTNLMVEEEAIAYQDPAAAAASFGEPRPEYQTDDGQVYQDIEALRETHIVEDMLTYRLKQTVRGLLLAVTVLVPVFFQTLTAPSEIFSISKQLIIYLGALVGLVLWLVIVVRQGGALFKRTGLEWGVAAWLGAALLATLFSVQVGHSFITPAGFITTGALALWWLLAVNFFEAKDIAKLISYWLLGSGVAMLSGLLVLWNVPVFAWVSWLSASGLTISASFNTVGSYNVLGALAALTLVLIGGQWFRINREMPSELGFWRVVKIATALVAVLLLLIINYWGFYVTVAAGMLVIVLAPGLVQRLTGNKVKVRAIAITGPLVVLVLSLLLALSSRYYPLPIIGQDKLPPEVLLGYSPSLTVAGRTIQHRPVFGWGPGNYGLAFDQYKPTSLNATAFWSTRFSDVTAEWLNTVTNYGLVGLLAFALLAGWVIRVAWVRTRGNQLPIASYSDLWAVLPVFVASLVLAGLFPFSNLLLLFVFWWVLALMGLALARPEDQRQIMVNNPSLTSVSASLGFILVLAFSLAGTYFLGQRWLNERAYAQVLRAEVSDAATADRAAATLAGLTNSPTADLRYPSALAQLFLQRINAELNDKKAKSEEVTARVQALASNVIQVAQVMTTQYGHDANSWTTAAGIYQNLIPLYKDADSSAVSAYREALKYNPNSPGSYVNIGNIFLARADQNSAALADARRRQSKVDNESAVTKLITEDYKAAEDNLKKAVALKPDLGSALYELGVVYERQNRLKDAIKQLETAAAGDFRNAGLAFELGLLYYRDNQKPQAFNEMTRAVALLPNYANARWYRALMLEEVGRTDDAIQELNEILKTKENQNNQTVIDKIAALEAGKREFPPAQVTSRKPL